MTVRGLLVVLALLVPASAEAAQCHLYSRWYYPWPQRCFGQKLASVRFVALGRGPSGPDIPLPSLARTECVGGEADELTRARLELLGYAYAH